MDAETDRTGSEQRERTLAYRVLRYTPNLVRDEWVNIGVLLYDPQTSERRLRLIEEPEELRRVRRVHPQADEDLLRVAAEYGRSARAERRRTSAAEPASAATTSIRASSSSWSSTATCSRATRPPSTSCSAKR